MYWFGWLPHQKECHTSFEKFSRNCLKPENGRRASVYLAVQAQVFGRMPNTNVCPKKPKLSFFLQFKLHELRNWVRANVHCCGGPTRFFRLGQNTLRCYKLSLGRITRTPPESYATGPSRLIQKSHTKQKSFNLGDFQIKWAERTTDFHRTLN